MRRRVLRPARAADRHSHEGPESGQRPAHRFVAAGLVGLCWRYPRRTNPAGARRHRRPATLRHTRLGPRLPSRTGRGRPRVARRRRRSKRSGRRWGYTVARVLGSRLVGDPSAFVALLLEHGADPTRTNLAGIDALRLSHAQADGVAETYYPRRSLGPKKLDRTLLLLRSAARATKPQRENRRRAGDG